MDGELLADQPLGQKLIKKGFWLYFFSFLVAPTGYIIKVLISNSVSIADVGVLYSIFGLVTFLNIYNDLGLTESLQYFLPRYWIKKQYNDIKTAIYLSLFAQVFTAVIIALFLRLCAPWLAQNYFHSPSSIIILKYFCFYFLGINIFQILQSIFVSFQNTFAYQFVDFIKMRSTLGFTFFFFLTGRQNIEWYSLNRILGLFVGILVASIIFYKKYKKHLLQGNIVFNKPMLKEYINYAFWCFVGISVGTLFGQIIQQLTIIILGPEQAGYYTNFFSLFSMLGIIVGPILGIIFPVVSELIAKKDTKKLSLLYSFFYTYFSVFSLLLISFFIVLGPEIALTLFGQKFVFSGVLFSRGAIFSIFTIFVGFDFSVLAGMGKIKERVKMMLISSLAVLIISLIGLYTIGIYGAILALGIGYLSLWLMSISVVYKNTSFDVNWKFIIKNIVIFASLSIILRIIKSKLFVFDDTMRYHNLGKIFFLGIAYFIIFVVVNYKETLSLKNEIIKIRGR